MQGLIAPCPVHQESSTWGQTLHKSYAPLSSASSSSRSNSRLWAWEKVVVRARPRVIEVLVVEMFVSSRLCLCLCRRRLGCGRRHPRSLLCAWDLQPHETAFAQNAAPVIGLALVENLLRVVRGFLAIAAYGLVGCHGFRGVYSDEPYRA